MTIIYRLLLFKKCQELMTHEKFFLAKVGIPNSIRTSVDGDFEKCQMARRFDKIANKCLFKAGIFFGMATDFAIS